MNLAGSMVTVLLLPCVALAQSYDLRANWSDADNPHGTWSYRDGTVPMTAVGDVQPGAWEFPQRAWVRYGPAQDEFAAWFMSNGSEAFSHEWSTGDIVCHTGHRETQPRGVASVAWTSPLDGTVVLTGGVWPGSPILASTPQSWSLWHEFVRLAGQTTLSSGSRSAPVPFLTATLDPISLDVVRGEAVRLEIEPRDSNGAGDYVGVTMNIIVCAGVMQDPAPARLCPGGSTFMTVQGRTSYGTLSYRWRRNGIALLEAPAAHYQGVFTPTLSITNASHDVAGEYDCVVSSICGVAISRTAEVGYCAADFDCSGSVGGTDIFFYLTAWFAGDARANVDGVAGVTLQDLLAFLNGWFTGC
jgi:hypothetical protein